MAAYDVFARNKFASWFMQRIGAFSVDREGSDRKAMKCAAQILEEGQYPLVIFPEGNVFGEWLQRVFAPTHIIYSLFLASLIIVFTYFYTAIAFNPVDVADNMKKQGGFIPGVRPGKSTAEYIDNILTRVTLPASIFLAAIAIFPTFLNSFFGVDFALASFYGGTSLLIIVGVALDTLQQVESHLLMRHYDGFLKSGKIKGRSKSRY